MIELPDTRQDNINLSQLKWVLGSWKKNDDNGDLEEYWYPQMGDAIAGWFRWKKGDTIFLYEFMLFQQVESNVVLKIKHFDAKLVGWEDKESWVEYQAWSATQNKIVLRAADPKNTPWMIYERIDSKLVVTFFDKSENQTDKYEFHS